ncbi:MAG: ferrous iron transporter B [Pseudomonadota bacterium]|nr:ferrous iron transporter B [Pseudomonadota bacterium]
MKQPSLKLALAAALMLASGTAAALGLGQIEVKSRLDQPLLAEIPIISSDPAELEQLQARLASPETFARVGLDAPRGLVSNLQFMIALDDRGNPVIRVTTPQPVDQPLLTFLIEVDWGQGRLVREYSALLDTPRTVSAPVQPTIQALVAAPSNTIVRPAVVPQRPPPVAATPVQPEPAADNAVAPTPTPRPAPVPAAPPAPIAAAPTSAPGEYGPVQSGDTLSGIAGGLDASRETSLNQTMVALLRANPEAFIDGNINLLRQGAVLRVPATSEVAGIRAAEALAVVRGQVAQWREATRAVPQPATETVGPASTTIATATPTPAAGSTTPSSGARLEIVPPGANQATQAGTQSGISAGGEGDMLRQQMQQTQETLAARDAELADMKSRIAELEKLQQQQQQLLTMKDSELAAAQQRLAQSGEANPNAAAQSNPAMPWVFGGIGLILLALLGWWFSRRRAATPVFRAPDGPSRASSLADAFPPAPVATPAAAVGSDRSAQASVHHTADRNTDVVQASAAGVASSHGASEESDPALWDRRERQPVPGKRAPTWHAADTAAGGDVVATATATDAVGHDRLELARAYVALGDHDSARQLLGEVTVNGDHAARQQAARMLRELG